MKVRKDFAKKVIQNFLDYQGGQTITHNYIYYVNAFTASGVTVYEVNRYPNIPQNSKFLTVGKEYVGTMTSEGLWISK